MPVMSEGITSGVNWMRRKLQPIERAMAFARVVLPMPGTSSRRMWPSEKRATRTRSMTSSLPTITRAMLARTRSDTSWMAEAAAAASVGGPWTVTTGQPCEGDGWALTLLDKDNADSDLGIAGGSQIGPDW